MMVRVHAFCDVGIVVTVLVSRVGLERALLVSKVPMGDVMKDSAPDAY